MKTIKGDTVKGLTQEQHNNIIIPGTILLGYRGSILHGTYTPKYGSDQRDDKDLLGVFVAPKEHYIGMSKKEHHIIEEIDSAGIVWDVVTYEIQKFIRLLLQANPNVMSLLFLPKHMYVVKTESGQKLIDNRDIFVSKRAYKSFSGYANGQLHRMTHPSGKHMGKKRRDLVAKFGYDTKNASCLIMLLRLGIEFLSTGEFVYPRPDATQLLEIKNGEWSLDKVKKEADKLFDQAREALIHSSIPEKPDFQRAERLCMDIVEKELSILSKNTQDTE